jgi:CRISPR-associated protein Cas2
MSLTVIVTRDVETRYRGFLASMLLEIAAGVYVSPQLNKDTRERIWDTLADWHAHLRRGSIVMLWRHRDAPGKITMQILGEPIKEIVEVDGLLLTRQTAHCRSESASRFVKPTASQAGSDAGL